MNCDKLRVNIVIHYFMSALQVLAHLKQAQEMDDRVNDHVIKEQTNIYLWTSVLIPAVVSNNMFFWSVMV